MASFVKVGLLLVAVVAFTGANLSVAKVFTVGDAVGWTILNSPNYTAWATGEIFHVGDTLLFKYNKQFHNVLEVKKADYTACKNDSALATYATGDDSITIKKAGHHYFICGFPGHCQLNQRVDILAASGSGPASAPASSAAPSVSPIATPGASSVSPISPTANTLAPASNASARLSVTLPLILGLAVTASAIIFARVLDI